MKQIKQFQLEKLNKCATTLSQNNCLLNEKAKFITDLNFSLIPNLKEYATFIQCNQKKISNFSEQKKLIDNLLQKTSVNDFSKEELIELQLNDIDLENFLNSLAVNKLFEGKLTLMNQNLTDETAMRISLILKQNTCNIKELNLSNNQNMQQLTGIYLGEAFKVNNTINRLLLTNLKLTTVGSTRVIESLHINQNVNDLDIGKLTNSGLSQLIDLLLQKHNLSYLSFGEDDSEPWKVEQKKQFLQALRSNAQNANLLSINIYSENFELHNRDNHEENGFKFSCKSYINNVFHALLDDGLFQLEKERMNILREEQIVNVTNGQKLQKFEENIFTAEGSCVFLAKYIFSKQELDEFKQD